MTNITGEKVYESQVNEAVLQSCQETQQKLRFQLTVADAPQARYEIYLELEVPEDEYGCSLSRIIDKRLSTLNREYSEKRKSGRLRPPRVHLLKEGTSEAYKRYQMARGQREGQYKLVTLLDKSEFDFPVQDYLPATAEGAHYAEN